MTDARFDEIIAGFYKAAAAEAAWTEPLDLLAETFGARLAVIQRVDLQEQRMLAHESGGGAEIEDAVLQYVREYHASDPRRAQILECIVPEGTWYHDSDHLDDNFVGADPFYQHFLAAYSSRNLCSLTLRPAPDQVVLFGMELRQQRGPLNPDERHAVCRIGQHVDEALQAYERIRRQQAQLLAGHQMLQTFDQPMWLMDFDRFVRDANAAAREEGRLARILVQRGVHLAASTGRMDRELLAILHGLRSAQHGTTRVLQQHLPGEVHPLWVHLTLLRPEDAVGAFGVLPMVLVTLFDPQQVRAFDPFALSSLLGLTPAQARVAAGLAEGRTAEDLATAGGTSVATVRSHIHQVLQRTGAHRAEDLVLRLHEGHALWAAPATTGVRTAMATSDPKSIGKGKRQDT